MPVVGGVPAATASNTVAAATTEAATATEVQPGARPLVSATGSATLGGPDEALAAKVIALGCVLAVTSHPTAAEPTYAGAPRLDASSGRLVTETCFVTPGAPVRAVVTTAPVNPPVALEVFCEAARGCDSPEARAPAVPARPVTVNVGASWAKVSPTAQPAAPAEHKGGDPVPAALVTSQVPVVLNKSVDETHCGACS